MSTVNRITNIAENKHNCFELSPKLTSCIFFASGTPRRVRAATSSLEKLPIYYSD